MFLRSLFLFLILICNHHYVNAQITVCNAEKRPIPFVQIFSSDFSFYSQSNLDGVLELTGIDTVKLYDTLYVRHVAFQEITILKKDLVLLDTLFLIRKKFSLPEVEIIDSKRKMKYDKLSVCYRSFQSNDNESMFYTDGKADYYIKKKNLNYEIDLHDHRSFSISSNQNEIPIHKTLLEYRVVGLPYLNPKYVPSNFITDHKLKIDTIDAYQFILVSENLDTVGQIEKTEEFIKFSFNDIYSRKSRKLLNTEVNYLDNDIILIYSNNQNIVDILRNDFSHLLYYKHNHFASVKHDKDLEYTLVRSQNELYIEATEELKSIPDLEFERNWGLPKSSSFSNEFWKNCNCEFYYPLDEKQIGGLKLAK